MQLRSSQAESGALVATIQIRAWRGFRSVRAGIHYRALGVPVPEGVQWFWIGPHAEYDKFFA
jgi:hypothetical protein